MRGKWFILFLPLLVLVWVLNASRPGWRVEGCFEGCASSGGHPENKLRVISLNMLHGFPQFENLTQRLELIANEIERLDVDIVLLQEVPWTWKTGNGAKHLAEKTGLNYAYQRANGNRWAILFEEGEAILSRHPLIFTDSFELKPREGFFRHRVVLHAISLTPLGNVDLYVVHLTNGGEIMNLQQTESLSQYVKSPLESFAIVAGDFNAIPESPQIQTLANQWIDTFASNNPGLIPNTCCVEDLGQGKAEPNKRIDFIFLLPGEVEINTLGTERVFDQPFEIPGGSLWVSDHMGLMVDFIESAPDSQ
jgi:endonuclease/exonuclease/phosphatase family metal-dependent hydrolase